MKRAILLLILAVLVAGCTSLGGGDQDDGDTPQVRGLVIEDASIVDPTVGRGRSTELILRVANTNPTPITGFSATLSNTGPVSTSGSCDLDRIAPATGSTPSRQTCVWTLDTSDVAQDDLGTYPIALSLSYDATLSMTGDTPKFTFTGDLPSRQTGSGTYTNGELTMTTTNRLEYASDADTVSIDITLEEVGSGNIQRSDGIRQVSLSYDGTLRDVFGFQNQERCTTANFLSDSTETTITCVLSDDAQGGSPSAGTTYNIRVDAAYTYERYVELPFTIVEAN